MVKADWSDTGLHVLGKSGFNFPHRKCIAW